MHSKIFVRSEISMSTNTHYAIVLLSIIPIQCLPTHCCAHSKQRMPFLRAPRTQVLFFPSQDPREITRRRSHLPEVSRVKTHVHSYYIYYTRMAVRDRQCSGRRRVSPGCWTAANSWSMHAGLEKLNKRRGTAHAHTRPRVLFILLDSLSLEVHPWGSAVLCGDDPGPMEPLSGIKNEVHA